MELKRQNVVLFQKEDENGNKLLKLEELREFIKQIPEDTEVTDIIIDGDLICMEGEPHESIKIPANLWVLGGIWIKPEDFIMDVNGDLYCEEVDAWDFIVNGDFICNNDFFVNSAKIAEDFICDGGDVYVDDKAIILGVSIITGQCYAEIITGDGVILYGDFHGNIINL